MSLDDWKAEVFYQLHENRAYQLQHVKARRRIQPVVWAQHTATVYVFINLAVCGLKQAIDALVAVVEPPALICVHPDRIQLYLERITRLELLIPTGCGLYSYDDILSKPAPIKSGLLVVENANELLDNLAKRNKNVSHFYQWSVGDYPIPNRHTHLILQPH